MRPVYCARVAALSCAATLAACGVSVPAGLQQSGDAPAISPRVLIAAHRGGAAYAPENTMTSFRNGLRLGADQIETDTQLTADGKLVLIHDATLDRTTDCSGAVQSKSFADIQQCDAAYWFSPGQPTTTVDANAPHPLRGTGVKVPATEELLALLQSLGDEAPALSIEIKDIPPEANFDATGMKVADVLVPLLQQYGLQKKTIVQSFWPLALDEVKKLDPSIRTQFLSSSSDSGTTAYQNLAYATARGHDIDAPNFDAPDFDANFVTTAHTAGKVVIPWTVDLAPDMTRIAGTGVDAFITNFPACALQLQGRLHTGRIVAPGISDDIPACPAEAPPPVASGGHLPPGTDCKALRPPTWLPATGTSAPAAKLRVVGIQYKQDARHVESYASYRTKMRCLMEEHAVPLMRPSLPMLVVFNEDIGLMTLATGARGTALRAAIQNGLGGPTGDNNPVAPVGAAAGLVGMNAAYAPQIAAYQAMFGPISPQKQVFVGATDTFVRAFAQTFSDIARDYGVYVVASNNMAHYRASQDPAEIALFGDPELQPLNEVYVATDQRVTNQTSIWAPYVTHPDAPAGQKNLLFANDKVPLTDIELTFLTLDEGPATGPEAIANAAGTMVEGFHLGFATSLPAFAWGYDFGKRPGDLEPCKDMHLSYMPCMDALGVDVVVQAEANPGRWAMVQAGGWQPLEWMESTWRTVAEPSVKFRYNVTPMMTGNLLDLAFDGQSAITKRGASATPRHYVGNTEFEPGVDPDKYLQDMGGKTEFLALAPWVIPDAPRATLADMGAKLAPGSRDPKENDYLETAVWADLTR